MNKKNVKLVLISIGVGSLLTTIATKAFKNLHVFRDVHYDEQNQKYSVKFGLCRTKHVEPDEYVPTPEEFFANNLTAEDIENL